MGMPHSCQRRMRKMNARWLQDPRPCMGFSVLVMVRDSHEALCRADFWLKKGSAQEREIVNMEPTKGQGMGSAIPAAGKEDSALVLASQCKCPRCMGPCKGDGAWGCQARRLQPDCSLPPTAQSRWIWPRCLWFEFLYILARFLMVNEYMAIWSEYQFEFGASEAAGWIRWRLKELYRSRRTSSHTDLVRLYLSLQLEHTSGVTAAFVHFPSFLQSLPRLSLLQLASCLWGPCRHLQRGHLDGVGARWSWNPPWRQSYESMWVLVSLHESQAWRDRGRYMDDRKEIETYLWRKGGNLSSRKDTQCWMAFASWVCALEGCLWVLEG